jgi:magnesium transporter
MIKLYKTLGGSEEIDTIEKNSWMKITQPTQKEITKLISEFNLPADSIQDILDADEMPRLEFEDEYSLVIMRIPVESKQDGIPYYTVPLGIFMVGDIVITLCSQDSDILKNPKITAPVLDNYSYILSLFFRSGVTYLKYLKQINQQTTSIEKDLEKSIKNSELNKLLKIEKCLVYFMTSIKSNEIVLAKLRNSKRIKGEVNEDLLEDALIENKQAQEMAKIHSDILSGTMAAFASIISNNLSVIMKKLTLISIVIMIPTLVASIFGMNVPNGMETSWWAIPSIIIFSSIVSVFSVYVMSKKMWF